MLPLISCGDRGPLIVMLHWLGGSSRTWTEVSEILARGGMRCVALDLPGFGLAAEAADTGIDATVEAVMETIASLWATHQGPWFIAGHSMGGKMAAIVARMALDGRSGLDGLQGLLLVSPSPPGPEPMKEATRRQMIEDLGCSSRNAEEDRRRADKFVEDNVGKLPLQEHILTRTVNDVLRMNRDAWTAWLTTGSKEDWSTRVGVLPLPALILAGTEEAALGPEAQQEFTLPHFSSGTRVALRGGGHLGPLERPAELAARMEAFVRSLGFATTQSSPLPAEFLALIHSDRTSPQTRAVLMQRLDDDEDTKEKSALSPEELLILRAVVERILPGCPFDLASRVQSWLGLEAHDGWRHDRLPPDLEAWQIGLRSLDAAALRNHDVPFVALDAARQDELLSKASNGKLGEGLLHSLHLAQDTRLFSDAQMQDWFGDLCAELTKLYVADPRIMQSIGFTGFADEGGFTQIRLDEREVFEQ